MLFGIRVFFYFFLSLLRLLFMFRFFFGLAFIWEMWDWVFSFLLSFFVLLVSSFCIWYLSTQLSMKRFSFSIFWERLFLVSEEVDVVEEFFIFLVQGFGLGLWRQRIVGFCEILLEVETMFYLRNIRCFWQYFFIYDGIWVF